MELAVPSTEHRSVRKHKALRQAARDVGRRGGRPKGATTTATDGYNPDSDPTGIDTTF